MNEPLYTTSITIMGVGIGVCLTMLIAFTMPDRKPDITNYEAFHERTNNTINGIWFPGSSFCVHMSDRNIESLKNTVDHEFLHELINNNHTCGNETCREHFCGGEE